MNKTIADVKRSIEEGHLNQMYLEYLNAWPLIHFSNFAAHILREGFKFGESNHRLLDCTYDGMRPKKHAGHGYAFAFNAAAWNVENEMLDFEVAGPLSERSLMGMHGESALLFAGDGLYTRHFDEFNQVICWGPDISTSKALLLTHVGPQDLGGEVVQDENGNDVDCWTLHAANGYELIKPSDYMTLSECVVKGICHLNDKRLLSSLAVSEAASLYEEELKDMGLSMRDYHSPSVSNER